MNPRRPCLRAGGPGRGWCGRIPQFVRHTFKHVLVPVWLVSYTYGSTSLQVLANGYTGALAGERPYSWITIFFAGLGALLLALIVFSLTQSQ